MNARPERPGPTYADIEALPEHLTGEILGGQLVVSPRPARPHAFTASQLGASLVPPFGRAIGGPGGWIIVGEPELHLDVDPDFSVVIPDHAGWRSATMPEVGDGAAFDVVPDWICEVLSPSTEGHDRALKMGFYAAARVGHLWFVQPVTQLVEVYRNVDRAWLHLGTWRGDAVVRAEPFEAVEIPLRWLWHRPPPPRHEKS